jgi:hypothetical protein
LQTKTFACLISPLLKLLQLHSLFVRRWLLLGKAVNVATSQ